MKASITHSIQSILKRAGYEIHRSRPTPLQKLLGASDLPIKTIIDVGANEGQFARFISTYFPSATIYCFEPVPGAFVKLGSWAATQGGRVRPFQLALGEAEGTFEMVQHDQHTASSSFLKSTAECSRYYPQIKAQSNIKVQCKTLDGAISDIGYALEPQILIKLDVQGYEDRVLRGGKETFAKANVAVLEVSLTPLYESQPTFATIVKLMDNAGFDYRGSLDQTCNSEGLLLSIDAVFFKRT